MEDVCNGDRHREKNVFLTKGNDVSRIMDEYGVYLRLACLSEWRFLETKWEMGLFCRIGVNCGRP